MLHVYEVPLQHGYTLQFESFNGLVGVRLCQRDSGCVWLGSWPTKEEAVIGAATSLITIVNEATTSLDHDATWEWLLS